MRLSVLVLCAVILGCVPEPLATASRPPTITPTVEPTASPAPTATPAPTRTVAPVITSTPAPSAPVSAAPRRWPATGLAVTESTVAPPVPLIANGRLMLRDGTSRDLAVMGTGLLGCADWKHFSVSSDGRRVAYETVLSRTRAGSAIAPGAALASGDVVVPAVRVLDLVTGSDAVLAENACDPLWSDSGALAFLGGVGRDGTVGQEYPTVIAVRSPDGLTNTWLDQPERRRLVGWAARDLIFERTLKERSELVVLSVDGATHALGDGAGVVAISPDGSRLLITTVPSQPSAERETVRLVRASDGVELSSLRLDPEVEALAEGGAWRGDLVLATIGVFGGGISHPEPRLFAIDVSGDHVIIRDEFFFATPLIGPGPFATVIEPIATSGAEVGALWFDGISRYVQCDLGARRCSLGPDLGTSAQLLVR